MVMKDSDYWYFSMNKLKYFCNKFDYFIDLDLKKEMVDHYSVLEEHM